MRKLLIFIALLFVLSISFATHQRAGEITYKHIGGLTFEFTIITYTYTPSPADRPVIDIFWGDNSSNTIARLSKIEVAPDISRNTYKATHTYSSNGIYSVTFEDANRNAGIINIPNSVNIPFFIETKVVINPFLGNNSSPILLNPPLDNGCVNTTYYHNVGAYDADGDSLTYKLIYCRGYEGGAIPGYTLPNASQYIRLDAITGDLIWETPTMQGEYNIAILISEYRNKQFMGSVVRDMQITIAACNNKPPQISCIDTCVIAGNLLKLNILVTDETSNSVTLTATGAPFMVSESPAMPLNVSGAPPLEAQFQWQTKCSHIKKSPYSVSLKATDDGPQVHLTAFKTVNIKIIAPAPQNLSATAFKNTITLTWDLYQCANAKEINIYKKIDSSYFEPSNCETGIPDNLGYTLLTKVSSAATSFIDDGSIIPVLHGREYCYRIVAVFADGAQSICSNETCTHILNDAPIITNVDIEKTNSTEGQVFISWLAPPEIDYEHFPGPDYEYRIYKTVNNSTDFQLIKTYHSLQDTSFTEVNQNTKDNYFTYKIEFWGQNKNGELEWIESSDPSSSLFLTILPADNKLKLSWKSAVSWEEIAFNVYRYNEVSLQFDSICTTINFYFDDEPLVNGKSYCYFVKSVGKYSYPEIYPLYNRSQVKCEKPEDNEPPDLPEVAITTDCKTVSYKWKFPNEESYLDVYQYFIYYQPNYKTPLYVVDSFYVSDVCFPNWCSYAVRNTPSITGCYAMQIVDAKGNKTVITPKLCYDIDECETYSLPNVFTPDGDGINDSWMPFPFTNVQKIELVVNDRWGKRVFKTQEPQINWDGKDEHSHKALPEGTYYYGCDVYLFTLEGVVKKFKSGIVTIIRNKNATINY